MMKRSLLAASLVAGTLALAGCSADPGSDRWCEAKKDQPKSEWTGSDAATFAKNCLIDGTEVGSEKWCEKLAEKPKGDWTASEASTYAKHCVI